MNKYARTNYEGCEYITAGKLYPVQNLDGSTFETIDDEGDSVLCWLRDCPHLDDNDWEIIEESEAMNSILVGKDAQKVAVMDWAEEIVKQGYWVDLTTRRVTLSCEAYIGKAGSGSPIMSGIGATMVTALIELMKGWEAIYGEAAELDREWKAFVSGLGDDAAANIEFGDNECVAVATTSGGEFLQYAGKNEAASKRGLMKAWAAING